ncbi:hypothetical protein CDL15_Pgr008465 [Punica granatum]|uniref:Uncharacterized protein n=1 Tax=Punica granatum TaxID=22663 RepID=A0A218WMT6_PUNGR|nr:hypothetical protein CDL15_Pgr008465 [Punica granatum]PKI48281.1 hypothetical protein CRG98_031339 [Punica granatum]
MELERNGVDLSEFFHMEYSADSETDSATDDLSKLPEPYYGLGDDDAESCICSPPSDHCLDWEGEEQEGPGDCTGDDACSMISNGIGCKGCRPEVAILGFMSEDEDGGTDGEEGMMWDLRREEVDAMEDRLFWETCMAVGYPMN